VDSMVVDSMVVDSMVVGSVARYLSEDLVSVYILASHRGGLLARHLGQVSIQALLSDPASIEVSDLALIISGRLDHR